MSTAATTATREALRAVPGVHAPEPKEEWFLAPFNAGDLDGVMALFEPEAACVTADGAVARGNDIRAFLGGLIAQRLRMSGRTTKVMVCGDLALLTFAWKLAGTTSEGAPVEHGGTAVLVLRRRDEATWGIVLEHPFLT
jgi:ketosteroid isomerase-like protein